MVKWYLLYLSFLVILLSGSSCEKKAESSAGVLSHSEMVATLIDVYLAEQRISILNVPRDSAVLLFDKLNKKVLEARNVQDSTLRKSYDYYLDHPKELEEIYSALVDSLNLREQRIISKPTVK